MGRRSRDKGAAGEREFASVAREAGIAAERTAQLQAGRRIESAPDVTFYAWSDLHVEVKRDERMSVDAMVRQSITDAAAYSGAPVPIVAWRRNGPGRKGWRIDCPAGHYLTLLAEVERLRSELRAGCGSGLLPVRDVEGDLLPEDFTTSATLTTTEDQ